ncbi:ferric reductase-like transmembrane protein [Planoprotostelium fungivorum]|uniref:Ferric reductase-like transmembrane protein n=1 Tax=Planoprotostelium fungivorum TaxID=1890364 RepID=A0A2P6NJU8_9EUKA|nr:ferric reductase-like transmembrane protein [Planoprotostelium fungivorum]
MASRLVLLVVTLALVSAATPLYGGSIKSSDGFAAQWSTSDWEFLDFKMSYPGKGWLSIGFTPNGGMNKADVYVGWVDSTGAVYLWVESTVQPSFDEEIGGTSDVTDIQGQETSSGTTISFRRRLSTKDQHDMQFGLGMNPDSILESFVIYASSSNDGQPKSANVTQIQIDGHNSQGQEFQELVLPLQPLKISTPGYYATAQGDMKVNWTLSEDGKALDFVLLGNTTGYISIGFNNRTDMIGADAIIAWVDDANLTSVGIIDSFCLNNTKPSADTRFVGGRQDVYNVSGLQRDGWTLIRFSRPIDTGDRRLDGPGIYLLLAWGTKDGPSYNFHGKNTDSAPMWFVSPVGQYKTTNFTLSWVSDCTRFITFTMTTNAKGYMAMGLNDVCGMNKTDMYVGWVQRKSAPVLLDQYYEAGANVPFNDTVRNGTSDLYLHSGAARSNGMTLMFSRKLLTGDALDHDITSSPLTLMYALSQTPPVGQAYGKHSEFGCQTVDFPVTSLDTYVPPVPVPTPPPANNTTPGKFSTNGFSLEWVVKGKFINFTMSAACQTYVSIGFNNQSNMMNADMIVGWVDSAGKAVLLDQWSLGNQLPVDDSARGGTNDINLISSSLTPQGVTLRFSRLLNTNDSNDRVITNKTNFHLLWAYGGKLPGNKRQAAQAYGIHSQAGSAVINFLSSNGTVKLVVSTDPPIDPGAILVIVMCGLILLWGICRLIYFLITLIAFRKSNRGARYEALDPAGGSNDVNSDYDEELNSNMSSKKKGRYSLLADDSRSKQHADKQLPPRTWRPVSFGLGLFNRIYGDFESKSTRNLTGISGIGLIRIPFTSIPLRHVILFVVYLAINLPSGPNTGKYWGTLIMGNAFISILPASRNSILTVLTGLPFERTVAFHRWVGRFTILLVLVHFFMVLRRWNMYNQPWQSNLWGADNPTKTNLYGLIGGIAGVVMFFTSLPWVRRLQWETFFWTHFLFFLFFLFAWLHDPKSKWYVIASIIVYGVDKVFRMVWGTWPTRTKMFRAKSGVVQIRFNKNAIANKLGRYEAGQYVFINIPSVNPLMWHPFSLSSSPDSDNYQERTAEVYVRSLGGFSKSVLKKANDASSVLIRVDGPYGNVNVPLTRYPVMIMVGGGIGITPIMGVLKDIYRVGDFDSTEMDKIPRHSIQDIHVLWTIQNEAQYEWFREDIEGLVNASRHPFCPNLYLSIHVTRPVPGESLGARFIMGRPNWKIVFDNVEELRRQVARSVFACGPTQMIRDVWDETGRRSRKGESFDFHSETFAMISMHRRNTPPLPVRSLPSSVNSAMYGPGSPRKQQAPPSSSSSS